jgi:hypothetical protein
MVEYFNGSTWVDITGSFDFSINGSNPRQLEVSPKDQAADWSPVSYRITPTSNLNCGGVTGTPDVYSEDVYEVTFHD